MSTVEALTAALRGDSAAAVALSDALDEDRHPADCVLLSPSFAESGVVAAARPLSALQHEELKLPSPLPSPLPIDGSARGNSGVRIVTRRGLLVGIVRSDEKGGIFLCDPYPVGCRGTQQSWKPSASDARLVVAPPPTLAIRNALVWARDWRRLPAQSDASQIDACAGIYEVLQSDLVVLCHFNPMFQRNIDTVLHSVGDLAKLRSGIVNVFGRIRCKSSVLAGRSAKPAFLLQLGSSCGGVSTSIVINSTTSTGVAGEEDSVFVVFSGRDAVCWWPYLQPGRSVCISDLSIAKLPTIRNRRVLRASGFTFQVCELASWPAAQASSLDASPEEEDPSPAKRAKVSSSLSASGIENAGIPRKTADERCSIVSFSGEVTKVMMDGRFELDNAVMLHLGAYGDWCAGPKAIAICFRKGARVVILNAVVAFQRGRPAALFPTARSFAYVEYFGVLPRRQFEFSGRRSYRQNPWRTHWKQLVPSEVMWAEELYSSLFSKFGTWLTDSQVDELPSVTDKNMASGEGDIAQLVVDMLLGSTSEVGLVRHVMALEGVRGSADVKHANVYSEFMGTMEDVRSVSSGMNRQFHALVPSICDFSKALDVLRDTKLATSDLIMPCCSRDEKSETLMRSYSVFFEEDVAAALQGSFIASHRLRHDGNRGIGAPFSANVTKGPAATQSWKRSVRWASDTVIPHNMPSISSDNGAKCAESSSAGFKRTHAGDCSAASSGFLPFSHRYWDKHNCSMLSSTRGDGVALIGLLEAAPDSRGVLRLVDATGSIDVCILGYFPPSMLGAVVKAHRFVACVETCGLGVVRKSVLFDMQDTVSVIDGPYMGIDPSIAGQLSTWQDGNNEAMEGKVAACVPPSLFLKQTTQQHAHAIMSQQPNYSKILMSGELKGKVKTALHVEASTPDLSVGECVDDQPLIALFVTSASVVGVYDSNDEGPPDTSFSARGRLLACCRSRRAPYWVPLGDDVSGFMECVIVFEGLAGVAVRAAVHVNRLYGISCRDIPRDVDDLRDWVWSMQGAPWTLPHSSDLWLEKGVLLRTGTSDQRVWLEDLNDGLSMQWEDEPCESEEEGVIEAALHHYSRAAASHAKPVSVSDLVSMSTTLPAAYQLVSFHGVVLSRLSLKALPSSMSPAADRGRGCDGMSADRLPLKCKSIFRVGDTNCTFAVVDLFVSSGACVSPVIMPGVSATFTDVVVHPVCHPLLQTAMHLPPSSDDSTSAPDISRARQLFLTNTSSVTTSCTARTLCRPWPTVCCRQPLDAASMLSGLELSELWAFSGAGSEQHGGENSVLCNSKSSAPFEIESAGVGYVRLSIVKVVSVMLDRRRVQRGDTACAFCHLPTETTPGSWMADAIAMFEVDDGTTTGLVTALGFSAVCSALRASMPDCDAIRSCIADGGALAMRGDDCATTVDGNAAGAERKMQFLSTRDRGMSIVRRLVARARREVVAVLRRQDLDGAEEPRGGVAMKGSVYLGFGKKIYTAVAGTHAARAECLAVFEESWWDRAGDEEELGSVQAAEVLTRAYGKQRSWEWR
jgi:hypothetical protein